MITSLENRDTLQGTNKAAQYKVNTVSSSVISSHFSFLLPWSTGYTVFHLTLTMFCSLMCDLSTVHREQSWNLVWGLQALNIISWRTCFPSEPLLSNITLRPLNSRDLSYALIRICATFLGLSRHVTWGPVSRCGVGAASCALCLAVCLVHLHTDRQSYSLPFITVPTAACECRV